MKILKLSIIFLILISLNSFAQKETPPQGGEPMDFKLPPKQEFQLDNGLSVTLVQYGNLPKVTVRIVVHAGNLNETRDEVWIADLTGELLKEGTESRSASQIAEQAASMGGSVEVSVTMDQSWIGGDVLTEFGPDLVNLLADIVRNPQFPESDFERLKKDFLRNLSISKTQPQSLAREKFLKVLYDDHPYGRMFPSEEMLQGYQLSQVKDFYENNYGAQRTHIYVVGKFDADAVEQAIRKQFSDWKEGPEPLKNTPHPQSDKKVYLVDRPDAPQSTLYIGLPVIDPTNPDYLDLQVTNTLLGGFFSSRITANIREDKGYTYSPRSSITSHFHDAFWLQVADVTTAVTGASLKEIFYEIKRLQETPPPPEELKGVQNYMAGTFVLRNSSASGIINQLMFINLQGLDDSYLSNYVKNVHSVTPEQVQEMARKYLDMDKMSIVVVGDEKQIRKQVSPYGKVIM